VRLLATMLVLGCRESPQPGPPPGPLGAADRFAAVDLDGDGRDELVVFADGRASWPENTASLGGAVHVTRRGDLDGDGRETLFVATGRGRDHRDASARVWSLSGEGADLIWEGNDGRNRVTDLRVGSQEIHISLFGADKQVEGGWIREGQFVSTTAAGMAMQQIPLIDGTVVLGRLYGDTPRSDGDLRIRGSDQADRILPTHRGVRTLSSADINGDGHLDLLVADGWHYQYGTQAQARLTLFLGPTFSDRRLMGDIPGEYTINAIELIPGTPSRVLATGTKHIHLFTPSTWGWEVSALAPISETEHATVWRDGTSGFAVLAGETGRAIQIPE